MGSRVPRAILMNGNTDLKSDTIWMGMLGCIPSPSEVNGSFVIYLNKT